MGDLWATYQSLVFFLGINAILALSSYVTLAAGQLSDPGTKGTGDSTVDTPSNT